MTMLLKKLRLNQFEISPNLWVDHLTRAYFLPFLFGVGDQRVVLLDLSIYLIDGPYLTKSLAQMQRLQILKPGIKADSKYLY